MAHSRAKRERWKHRLFLYCLDSGHGGQTKDLDGDEQDG